MNSLIHNITSGAATILLTSGNAAPIGRSLAGLTVYSTVFGLEKKITTAAETLGHKGSYIFGSENKDKAFACIKIASSIALHALTFYAALQLASTTLAFVAIPVATLSVKNACLAAIVSAAFAKAFDIPKNTTIKELSSSNREPTPITPPTVFNKKLSIKGMDPIFSIPAGATIQGIYSNGTTYQTEEYLFFLTNKGEPFRVLSSAP